MRRKLWLGLGAMVAIGVAGRVVALGIPTTDPLVYSATVQQSNGQPLTTATPFDFALFAAATGGSSLCSMTNMTLTPDDTGRVRIPLSPACVTVVRNNPDVWTELRVNMLTMPRQKINAVPYAVEAQRATRLVRELGSSSISMNGLYCARSVNMTAGTIVADGGVVGYRATKAICEETCARPTAHLCTAEEIIATYMLGTNPPQGWVQGSIVSSDGTNVYNDCSGFTSSSGTRVGAVWDPSFGANSGGFCNIQYPVLCCD